ncbi:hypothetical protein ABZX85_27665 [Streptomyces sp. NPDC004539]|uniref:hypothetical protein n=1 Tax=Streptomyces sp. NPDC004539 TaxID=3154280 RepID=UPI0033A4B110
MRLAVDVVEGDWVSTSHSLHGVSFWWALGEMIREGRFDASDRAARWADLDRQLRDGSLEFHVRDADLPSMTVGELRVRCLAEARRLGAARPEPPSQSSLVATSEDRIICVWLSDAVTGERLDDRYTLGELGLADGDLLVLCIKRVSKFDYAMPPPRNPSELLCWLQLAENATAPVLGPRLWGVLLYTDADVELATYVRTHFDDLNVLSGPVTRVFVVERRRDWRVAKRYWRRHLEPELYRVMSTMRWLDWTPYDPQGAYEIASMLGLGPEKLPCLVFFHSRQGSLLSGDKVLFPLEDTSTAYFRALFGGIARALGPLLARQESLTPPAAPADPPAVGRLRGLLHALGPRTGRPRPVRGNDGDAVGSVQPPEHWECVMDPGDEHRTGVYRCRRGDAYAPAPEALSNLLAAARAADGAAFEAVCEARDDILAAARAKVPAPPEVTVTNSQVVIKTGGAGMSESFNFKGENTTFVNRPQNTVIQDFQNAHGTATGADELVRLLSLVLTSAELADADREEATGAIYQIVRLGTGAEADPAGAGTRLERLRELLGSAADIAQPALAILTSLTALFAGQ